MDKFEALTYWKNKKDRHTDRDAVGVTKDWNKVKPNFEWERLEGALAWNRISLLYPPNWNNWPRKILKEWVSQNHPNYNDFINQENSVNKFSKLLNNIISDDEYIAFVDITTGVGMLVDGNHRYIDINYLIRTTGKLKSRINNCTLDIFKVNNLAEVIPDCNFLGK